MIFFMSRKNLDRYVAEQLERDFHENVESYVRENVEGVMEQGEENAKALRNQLRNVKSEFCNMDKRVAELEMARRNAETGQIWEYVSGQKRRIADLECTIQSQEKVIEGLLASVRQLQNKAAGLPLSGPCVPVQKPIQETGPACDDAAYPASADMPHACIFTEDPEVCKNTLRNFVLQSRKLRDEIQRQPFNEKDLEIYVKLVDKCIKKFEDLEIKNSEKPYEPGKLAHDAVRILKQTIARAMSQKGLKQYLEQYMDACHVRKLGWKTGRKLTDEDYSYLEEPICYEEVNEPGLHHTVMAVMQDTFVIDYQEEGGCFEAVISGIYSIGNYRN